VSRTVLIGLDGATFATLDPYIAKGMMPFLRAFIETGARATLRTVIPALTPPAWTSLMTGKRPGHHGIFDFFQKDSPDSQYLRFASSQDIGAKTIWGIASEYRKRVIALNFPLMFPAPPVNGSIVPGGWMPWRQLRLGCYPSGLFDRLKALPSFNPRELALDMAMEDKALEGCPPEEYADWIQLHIRRERRWFDIVKFLFREEPSDLIGILFDGVDKLQHLCWRFIEPDCFTDSPSEWDIQIRDLCEGYFRQLDELIAEIVALAGPEATTLIASDHGFGPTSAVFYVNSWLEQHGYLGWAEPADVPIDGNPLLGMSQIARHVHQLDWTRTKAYASTPSSNGIHIVTKPPGSDQAMPAEEYAMLLAELISGLRGVRNPTTGEPVVEEVWAREQVFAGPFSAGGPDLTLVLVDGGLVSILRSDAPVKPRRWTVGTHRPDGVFLARGPGVIPGTSPAELSILDVAPLLLYSLELPVPSDIVGRVPTEIFEPSFVASNPVRTVAADQPATVSLGASANTSVFDAEAETTMMKRLRALGYVE
jgi:predicted AlkP superfamily phosphohydrolase/phosphomutase